MSHPKHTRNILVEVKQQNDAAVAAKEIVDYLLDSRKQQ